MNHSQITSFIWSVAGLSRGTFKRSKYQDVNRPLTALRRIDQALEPTEGGVGRVSTDQEQSCASMMP